MAEIQFDRSRREAAEKCLRRRWGEGMSRTIYYRSASKTDPCFDIGAPSSFIESIERAFGTFPLELDENAIPVLRGMAAVAKGNADDYEQVINKIKGFGSITIYVR